METLLQDLRYGFRMLLRSPVVSSVAALSLAAGIAASASALAIVDSFIFEPLPYEDQETLVMLREGSPDEPVSWMGGPSVGSFRAYEAAVTGLEEAVLYTVETANLTGVDAPEQIAVVAGTPNLLRVVGGEPRLGRDFRPEEGVEGRGNVVILEHDFWMNRFDGDPDVLGRTLVLDEQSYTVVGVTPENFDMLPADVDAFRPTDFAAEADNYADQGYMAFGRLAPGASPGRVDQEVATVHRDIARRWPDETRGEVGRAALARELFPGPTDTRLVLIMAAVALFGLLIACVNVANLLLSRAEERQKEVAVRTAMGAGRLRILRQLLTESVLLGGVAGAAGIGLAIFGVGWLREAMPPQMPRSMFPSLDPGVLAVTVILSILAGVLFGLAPALHALKGDLREALGEGSRGGTASRSRKRVRNLFVMGEFAVALAVLTGAGYMVEVFDGIIRVDPGFRQEDLLTFEMTAPENRFPGEDELRVYQDELVAALGAVPGTQGVAVMRRLPRGQQGVPQARYTVPGRVLPEDADLPIAWFQTVNPDYFATMEIPVVQGRSLAAGDREDARPVVVVSEDFAAREFPGEEVLGRQIQLEREDEPRTVVGVVSNTVQQRILGGDDHRAALYVPLAQDPLRTLSFALRFPGDPGAAAPDIREAVWAVNPDQPLARIQTLDAHVAASLAGPRALAAFMLTMGAIALLLAALGIYGVMAHAVVQQEKEIGIRMALGAGRRRVLQMVARSGLTLVGAGMLVGIPLAWLMYRAVLNTVGLFDPQLSLRPVATVTLSLILVAAVSTLVPAARATRVAPAEALSEG